MMDGDLISRQAVENAIAETIVNGESLGYSVAYDILSDLPSVTDGDLISRREVLKCFNIKELKFKNKEDAELVKHYLELSFNDLAKLSSYNSIKTELNELNEDLISRQAVIDVILSVDNGENHIDERTTNVIGYIEQLPSAEKTAKWIITGTKMYRYKKCSNCECAVELGDMWKFCPNCGARIKGQNNE